MTSGNKCSLRNSENLTQLIKMQLSKNLKTFSQHLAQFLESTSTFKQFEKKVDTPSLCIVEVADCERHG